ncbi:HpcH/HpaI aldolase/citrate lyase family protein [Streptomyces sp. NBC_01445]|uniref:HpcH/HpaI aldolase/citrate lyase family protein n=1 Tax=Streptomyces sp. NBC_01445 TaxID=2903869 RepID=UPI002DDA77F3|nr:CoA ester lyase [Streptomyces sp. NBC_01445]
MSAEHTTVEPASADPARPELADPERLSRDRARLAAARTLLFVPGHRPDRFEKAAAAGADAVIVDLEDAVAPDGKDAARRHAADWLARGGDAVVRINAPGTAWWDADLDLVTAFGCPVMLPKAEDPEVIARIAEVCAVIPLVETAAGIERALDVCCAPGVVRAAFGSVDLATELGVRHDDTLALAYGRSRLVMACAAAGVAPPLDGVTTALDDADALAQDLQHARRLGFGGKLCIHPKQLPAVSAGFAPTDEELAWARKVLAAGDAVSAVDGVMVDRPVQEQARRLLGVKFTTGSAGEVA